MYYHLAWDRHVMSPSLKVETKMLRSEYQCTLASVNISRHTEELSTDVSTPARFETGHIKHKVNPD